MSARDVIAAFLLVRDENVLSWERTDDERADSAKAIIEALTDAGHRNLGPDELKTIRDAMQMAISSMEGDCEAHHKIALNTLDRAIRSLIPAQPEAKEDSQ